MRRLVFIITLLVAGVAYAGQPTGLWKLQNDTWVRGRDWYRQSTITSGSNRQAAHK